jgi:hypothetical protein
MEYFMYKIESIIKVLLLLSLLSVLISINTQFAGIRDKFNQRNENDYSVINGSEYFNPNKLIVKGEEVISQIKALKQRHPQTLIIIVKNLESCSTYGFDERIWDYKDYNIYNQVSKDYIFPLANYQKKHFFDKDRVTIEYTQQQGGR